MPVMKGKYFRENKSLINKEKYNLQIAAIGQALKKNK
jgi:hypothetical protein